MVGLIWVWVVEKKIETERKRDKIKEEEREERLERREKLVSFIFILLDCM